MDIFLLFVAVCAAFIYTNIVEKRRRRDSDELMQQISSLTSRLYEMERNQTAMRQEMKAAAAARTTEPVPPPAAAAAPVITTAPRPATEPPKPMVPPEAPTPAPIKVTIEPEPARPAPPPMPVPPTVAAHEPKPPVVPPAVAPAVPKPPADASHREPPPIAARVAPPAPARPAPLSITQPPAQPSAPPAAKAAARSVEWNIGTNLLPKIGIVLLVLGLAWLASWIWSSIPRGLRIVLLYSIGPGLLGTGIFLEAKENFKTLARMLIGGGWAWTFTMTLFIYWLPAVKIIQSPEVDLILLLAVAAAMVWHTLKYNSQAVTAAAFFLAFLGIVVTPETGVFSPVAGLILIAGMTGIVLRRHWFELEIFGILASYASHAWWLYQIFHRVPDHAHGFPDSTGSIAIVICYWAIFRGSYLLRKIQNNGQENTSTIAALLNPLLFLAVMRYQSLHHDWAFYALLAMGAVEFILGQLPAARLRKAPFYILSSLGATLMIAAVPFKYAGRHALEILWLAGAEAFLLAGIFAGERLFRRFAGIISFLVAGYLLFTQVPILLQKLNNGTELHDAQLSLIFAAVAVIFYLNSHVISRWRPDLFDLESEMQAIGALSFLASIFAVGAIYSFFTPPAVAVALGVLIALLCLSGMQFRISQTIYQSHWIALVTCADVCINGLALKKTLWHGFPEIILTFGSVAALFYLSSRFVRLSESSGREVVSVLYKWAATTLLTILIWYWAPDWLVAVYWAVLALVLAFVAQWQKRSEFNWQALALALLACGYALGVNLQLTDQPVKGLSHRLISMTLIAGIVYLLARWSPMEELKPAYSWAGTIVLGALTWKEAPKQWTAVLWISLAACLALAARYWKERALLWQCHIVSAVALVWMIFTNFQPDFGPAHGPQQLIAVLFTSTVFYALTWIVNIPEIIGDEWVAHSYSWAGSLLVSWLIWYQRQAPHEHERALYWAAFGLLLFEIGYKWKPGFLRSQGYVAMISSFVYIFFANFNVRPSGLLDPNVLTVMPLIPIYYWTYYRLHTKEEQP